MRYIDAGEPDIPFAEVGTPTWDGLPLDHYLSLLDMLNPMHRLVVRRALEQAHCRPWLLLEEVQLLRCTLDYISRYDSAPLRRLVDRIEGRRRNRADGISFRRRSRATQSLEGTRRGTEQAQSARSLVGQYPLRKVIQRRSLCRELADSGCIAISGGLEVASDRCLS